jgi:hypothetical protein
MPPARQRPINQARVFEVPAECEAGPPIRPAGSTTRTEWRGMINSATGNRRSWQWGLILVGTDGSDGAARAVEAAAALAVDLRIELWIAYVIDREMEPALTRFAHAEDTSIGDSALSVRG